MNILPLRNGATEPEPLVHATMLSLRTLFDERPIHFYELAQIARHPQHSVCSPRIDADLRALGLLGSDGGGARMHESIRNIMLSAVDGEGLDMQLRDPRKET